ncbi:MAG TPA: kelch repeat-containing protein, partial [Deinococcales bacterium]|nr:kelch repeat-containing protein [Deinococcales bacterium]
TWTDKAELSPKRGALSSGLLGGKIVVFGGEYNGNTIFNNTEAYDAASDSWQELPPMITGRHGTHGVTVGNWIYSTGGAPDWGVPTWTGPVPGGKYDFYGTAGWGPMSQWTTDVTVNEAFGVDPPLAAAAGAAGSSTSSR